MDPERPTVLLDHYLKLLKLPTIKREYKTVAAACAKLGHDAIEFAARDRKLEAARAERKVRRQAARNLARLWWACPPRRGGARTNPLHITVRYGKLTPPGETEAGNPGEEPIAPTGTFLSAERRAKG
jgi:hypothetical protein